MKNVVALVFAVLIAAGVFGDDWDDEWPWYDGSGWSDFSGSHGRSEEINGIRWAYGIEVNYYEGVRIKVGNAAPAKHLIVPSSFGGFPTTDIDDRAFSLCKTLQTVLIPGQVKVIGDFAFEYCPMLQSVTMLSGVETIGDFAFQGCESLRSVVIPATVKSIGSCAFAWCRALRSVKIPSSVTTIGGSAFERCFSLQSLKIGRGVAHIGGSAFRETSLRSVEIPAGVKTIGDFAFYACSSLTSVTIPASTTKIGEAAFAACRSLQSVAIQEGVPTIGDRAFENCSALQTITFRSGLTSIGCKSFSGCVALQSVVIPASVTTIGEDAFIGCEQLKTIYVEQGDARRVKDLMRGKCPDVDRIEFLELKDGFQIDDDGELIGYRGEITEKVIIRNGVTKILANVFAGCSEFESITIPRSVVEILEYAFLGCYNLKLVYVDAGDIARVRGLMQASGAPVGKMTFIDSEGEVVDRSSVTSVAARQCYPWNGKVDVEVQFSGIAEDMSYHDIVFEATDVQSGSKLETSYILNIGGDVGEKLTRAQSKMRSKSMNTSEEVDRELILTQHYVWDVKADIGEAKVNEVNLKVLLDDVSSTSKNFALDSQDGNRIARETEMIEFSPHWETDVDGAEAVVCVNGNEVVRSTEAGVYEWTPSQHGLYNLTHKVMLNGEQIGETLSASFYVENDGDLVVDSKGIVTGVRDNDLETITIPSDITGIEANAFKDATNLKHLIVESFEWAKGDIEPKEETQWFADGEYEGKKVYVNNDINDSESTSIEFLIPDGTDSISFAWKVDSEQGYDCLHWYLDEEERGCISGEQDWTIITEELSEGEHTLKFVYSKDESVANGSDAGWVAILTDVVPNAFADCQIKELTLNESAGKVPYSFFATVPSVEKINVPSKEWWLENAPTNNNPVAEGTASLYVGGEKVEWGLADGGPYTEIVDGVEYTFYVENGEAMIRSRYSFLSPAIPTSTSGTLIVPGILGNCPVTRIGDGAFFRCDSLEDVQLPDGLITIGDCAFSDCFSLQSVTIPDSVTTIGEGAFLVCGSLHTIVLSESLKEIGDFAFDCCGLLSVLIPKGVTKIGTSTFNGCESLQSVTFTDGLTEIGEYAFERCMSLETVSIPGSVKKIGRSAFCGCTALCTAMLHEGLEMIEDYAFEDCASLQFVEIPSSVTTIGECTFCRCETLESLTLHEGLKEIGALSFQGCNSLQTVILPNGLTTIGESAFSFCESLQSVTIPESVTADIWGLFYWSESIKEIVGLVWNSEAGGIIPNGMFPNLERVVVSRHMTEIVPYQFSGCSSLTSVVIPDSVTKIGESAFMGCDSLETLPIPKSVTEIGDYAFSYCTLLQSITIPENVTEIGEHAFWMCESLRSAILPATLISIGDDAFGGCKSLQSITIPDGVTTIGNCAFWGCESFQTITIPESVTDLGEGAFDGCSSLKEIVGWRPSIGLLYDVERIVVSSRITEIDRGAFWGCESLQTVILPDGLTTIRESAFEGCSSLALVTIPSSVAMLGEHAFERCCSLTSVEIPTSVMVIPDCAFSGCSALERVSIPAGVSVIGDGAFIGCGFTLITIPESVTVIGDLAFADCDSLQSITIPGGVTTMGAGAFIECTSLTAVDLRKGLTTIGDDAFLGCGSLQSITIPTSVTEIGRTAFYECSSLNIVYVDTGDKDRVKELMRDKGVDVDSLEFVERTNDDPSIEGDNAAEVFGDAESGFVIKPSAGTTEVVITIPEGIAAEKVTIEVSPSVQSVKANGATIKVVKGAADITKFLDIPAAVDGVVNLGAAEVKEAIVKETLDPEKGAVIQLSAENPTLTTTETKPGLTYTLLEGATLESMGAGASKVGDGMAWTPEIKVKGGASAFYSIRVTK